MTAPIRLGLRENLAQFTLLVLVNGFVGAMVGMERVVIPLLAEEAYGLASYVAVLSFIVTFGSAKALANLMAGRLGDQYGRKRLLIAGWLFGIPVPLLLMWAPSWGWVVFANVLLGFNQGFSWTMTVVMKIDLVGPKQRGLALGINESVGYMAVAGAAFFSGLLMASGSTNTVFQIAVAVAVVALLISVFFIRETTHHVAMEAGDITDVPSFGEVFRRTSWTNRKMFAACQAGLINNLNDGLAWGLFPFFFASLGLTLTEVSGAVALYPLVWGFGQLFTGRLADRIGRTIPIVSGMILQGISLLFLLSQPGNTGITLAMIGQGFGTALVYPSLLAVISDASRPDWRSSSLGVYRLWRDGGYVVGAVMAGLLADNLGIGVSIGIIGGLTVISGLIALINLKPVDASN